MPDPMPSERCGGSGWRGDFNAWRAAQPHRCKGCPDCDPSSSDSSTGEEIARAFHAIYEDLAPHHGYETRTESAVPWEHVPEANRNLMVATVKQLLHHGTIVSPSQLHATEVERDALAARVRELEGRDG